LFFGVSSEKGQRSGSTHRTRVVASKEEGMIGVAPVYFEDLEIGHEVEGTSITCTEAHLVLYAGISGDFYKLHMNAHAAEQSPFGRRVAHGPLTLVLTIGQLAQRFTNLYLGDTLTPLAKIVERRERDSNGLVTIEMIGKNQDDVDVFVGRFALLVALSETKRMQAQAPTKSAS
jgi:acyl dehydratase